MIGLNPFFVDMNFLQAIDRFIIENRTTSSRGHLKNYEFAHLQLERSFGLKIKMSEVTPQDVSAHIVKRLTVDRVGPTSIRAEMSLIRMVYTKAVEWGVRIESPEKDIKRPKATMRSREERLDNVIKPTELRVILSEADCRRSNLGIYLRFLLYTGMRPTEAAHLYWRRMPIDQEREMIKKKFPIGYVDLDRGGFTKIGTKTEKRFVPGHPKALEIIEKLRKTADNTKRLVFLDDKLINNDLAYKYYRRSMQTVMKNAKLPDGNPLRQDITFYSFRHTFRSRLEECGVSTGLAETIIGHNERSFKFTYIHVSDEALIKAVRRLEFGGL